MTAFANALGASNAASSLLVLFIPSKDRSDLPIDRPFWVTEALTAFGTLFGMAKNINKIALGLGAVSLPRFPKPVAVPSVRLACPVSSRPCKPGSPPARAAAQAVPPMPIGSYTPKCRCPRPRNSGLLSGRKIQHREPESQPDADCRSNPGRCRGRHS